MLQLGLLCLGAFVGTISTYGLKFIDRFSTFGRAVTIILSAALGGAALFFIERFQASTAIGSYEAARKIRPRSG